MRRRYLHGDDRNGAPQAGAGGEVKDELSLIDPTFDYGADGSGFVRRTGDARAVDR